MLFRIFADLVTGVHLLFVLFVLFGGLLVLRWPRLAWAHVPAALWGVVIEIGGWICPLTYLENDLRHRGLQAGYGESFVDHYILPLIYPALWFPGDFPDWGFPAIGLFVLVVNLGVYGVLWRRNRRSSGATRGI